MLFGVNKLWAFFKFALKIPGAFWVGLLVVSHWLLDFIAHAPDMPILFYSPKFGLGLWNSVVGTLAVEGLMFAGAIYLYLKSTEPANKKVFWAFIGLLAFTYAGHLFAPPPPDNLNLVTMVTASLWVCVPWCWWIEKT